MVGWLMFSQVFIFNHHFSKWPFLEVPLVGGAPRPPGTGGAWIVVTRVDTLGTTFSAVEVS